MRNSFPRDNRGSSILRHFKKTALFLRKFQLVIIEAVQIFKSLQQNCFTFDKILPRDDRGSVNFQVTLKSDIFFRKFQLVIIGAVQVLESFQQICFMFWKISAFDNRESSSSRIISTNLLYVLGNFSS